MRYCCRQLCCGQSKETSLLENEPASKCRDPITANSNQTHVEITDDELSFEDVKVWLARDGEILSSIPVNSEDGRIQLLPMAEQQARSHALRINHPEEAVNINFELKVIPPSSTSLSYRDIFHLVDDANRYINIMAGGMAFFAPKVDTLKFHFTEPAKVTISAQAGLPEFETERIPA